MQLPKHRNKQFLLTIVLMTVLTLPVLTASWDRPASAEAHALFESCGGFVETDDQDGDGLTDVVETETTQTNPCLADTDGDGLLDPWEVSPGIPGAGFNMDSHPDIDVTRDEVFGPYAEDGNTNDPVGDGRVVSQFARFVRPPNPLHKDIYFELDWQDCLERPNTCPEPIDPTHHAPDVSAIMDVVQKFNNAPVTNPDGLTGINLHILVDERLKHFPNCDRSASSVRAASFGTFDQRVSSNHDVVPAKELAFRYITIFASSLDRELRQRANSAGYFQ